MDLLLFWGAKFGGIEVVKWVFMALMIKEIVGQLSFTPVSVYPLVTIIRASVFAVALLVLMLLGAPVGGVIWTLLVLELLSLIFLLQGMEDISDFPLEELVMTVCNIIGIILFYVKGLV